jgi:hypothetical protein
MPKGSNSVDPRAPPLRCAYSVIHELAAERAKSGIFSATSQKSTGRSAEACESEAMRFNGQ